MSITPYTKEVSPGVTKKFFLVQAEGINKYTGKRVQKKQRGITSKVVAERIYKELWNLCREERPDGPPVKTWGELKTRYFEHLEKNVRSSEKPNGMSARVIATKKSRFTHVQSWETQHIELMTGTFVKEELDKLEAANIAGRPLTVEIQKATSAVLTFAVQSGWLVGNPLFKMKRKKPKKRKTALTHVEVDKLLLEARKRQHPYFLVWLLSVALGLRRSELAGLKWSDINYENGLIYLARQLQPIEGIVEMLKDTEDRVVSIPSFIIPVLKEYQLQSTSEFVIDLDCPLWQRGHQAQVLKAFCLEIGIKVVTHRQLRTTHISLAIQDGIELGAVKDNVGHAKLSTTDVYYAETGLALSGKMDRLRIKVPTGEDGEVLPLHAAK